MKKILLMFIVGLMAVGNAAAKAKAPAKETKAGEWKGPYTSITISPNITKYIAQFRKDVEDYDELAAGGKKKEKALKAWQEKFKKWHEKFEKAIAKETSAITKKANALEDQMDKFAELEEKFFEDEKKMAEIQKKSIEVGKMRVEYDAIRGEYEHFTNACWPAAMREKKHAWTKDNPYNTVGKSVSLDGTTISLEPMKYSLSSDPAKAKIVVFTSLKHRASLKLMGELSAMASSDKKFPVSVVNVNVDQDPKAAKAFYGTKKWKYAVLADSGKVMSQSFGVKFLPHVAVVNSSGSVAAVYVAAGSRDKSDMRTVLKDLKKGKPVAKADDKK
ncbi:hypothetical protein BVY04_03205 [bacterium M21]|nr:hypothetical protein BVY04_03205 [bacterium M21]